MDFGKFGDVLLRWGWESNQGFGALPEWVVKYPPLRHLGSRESRDKQTKGRHGAEKPRHTIFCFRWKEIENRGDGRRDDP